MRRRLTLLLALYCTGIIVGGGILALPFVATDCGLIGCAVLLLLFALLFNWIYWRILSVVSEVAEVRKDLDGLRLYDESILLSGLGRLGILAFTVGLALYTIPADFVYVLYGSKSIVELHHYVHIYVPSSLIETLVSAVAIAAIVSTLTYIKTRRKSAAATSKTLTVVLLWLVAIWVVPARSPTSALPAIPLFALSLAVIRYFPEDVWKPRVTRPREPIEEPEAILPHHRSCAWFSLLKVILVCATPLVGAVLIFLYGGIPPEVPLLPVSLWGFLAPVGVIIFMYVGSGVYNILVYDWVRRSRRAQREISFLAILFSLIAYEVFTTSVVMSVDRQILVESNAQREHALIAMSDKLYALGLTLASYLTIIVADIFAMVSVAVAFVGFTDTLSERLRIDLGCDVRAVWFFLLALSSILVALSELFQITNAATDALSYAGAAGGGLFLLVLPWLMRGKRTKRRTGVALAMLALCAAFNTIGALNSATTVGTVSGLMASAILLAVGLAVILRAMRSS